MKSPRSRVVRNRVWGMWGFLVRLWRLSFERQRLLCRALYLLCLAAVCVRSLAFWRVAVFLGEQGFVAQQTLTLAQQDDCKDWAWALQAVSRRLPWKSTCLMQALAGQWGLRRQAMAGTVYLGVAEGRTGASNLFDAHAWLCCGQLVLTGALEAARFKPIVWFGTRLP